MGDVQYVAYMQQQRQRQILAAQQAQQQQLVQQGQPSDAHYSGQHHSMHGMAQTHKKLKKQQQGAYGYPGQHEQQQKHLKSKSRHGSQNVMKTHAKNNYGQQSGVEKVHVKGISNKLEDYYSTSSDTEHDEESSDDSSTIASTDSDDENGINAGNAHLDSSTDESSIVSDILKEGANIPALNDMEGPMNNLNLDVNGKRSKKKKKHRKKR